MIVIDDAKISKFLVVSEELVMVMMMMTMMPRFVGFLPIKSPNLVTGDGDDGDGDGDDGDGDSDDDAKICWFLAYKIHKSCCLLLLNLFFLSFTIYACVICVFVFVLCPLYDQ